MLRKLSLFFFPFLFATSIYAGESTRSIVVLDGAPLSSMGAGDYTSKIAALDDTFKLFGESVRSVLPQVKILTDTRVRFAIHAVVVEHPKELLPQIRRMPGVKLVEEDRELRIQSIGNPKIIDKSETGNLIPLLERSVELVGAKNMHARGIRGDGIRIAIVDTGIDWTHPDLGGGFGEGFKVEKQYNGFSRQPTNGMDDHGHGTHVSGIAAGVNGVAPGAKLWAIKVLNKDGTGFLSWILEGIDRAMDFDGDPNTKDGADVINLSLGYDEGDPYDSISIAVNEAMRAGVVVAVAAGNAGPDFRTVGSPGAARDIISVGATDIYDNLASFSSRGPVPVNSSVKPDILAPGKDITSTFLDGEYATWSGTSMATPHVAGAAALLKQANKNLTAYDIKSLLLFSSEDLLFSMFGQGYGRLQVDAAETVPVTLERSTISIAPWQGGGKKSGSGYAGAPKMWKFTNQTNLPVSIELTGADEGDWKRGAVFGTTPDKITIDPASTGEIETLISAAANMGVPSSSNGGAFMLPVKLTVGSWERIIPVCLTKK